MVLLIIAFVLLICTCLCLGAQRMYYKNELAKANIIVNSNVNSPTINVTSPTSQTKQRKFSFGFGRVLETQGRERKMEQEKQNGEKKEISKDNKTRNGEDEYSEHGSDDGRQLYSASELDCHQNDEPVKMKQTKTTQSVFGEEDNQDVAMNVSNQENEQDNNISKAQFEMNGASENDNVIKIVYHPDDQ